MEKSKTTATKKELAIYFAYGVGVFMLLMGVVYPSTGQQLWGTIIGAMIVILAHVSYECEGVKIVVTKLKEGYEEGQ